MDGIVKVALAIGAVLLVTGMGRKQQPVGGSISVPAQPMLPGLPNVISLGNNGTTPANDSLAGNSADEDIGIAPVGGLGAGDALGFISVENSNTPVIDSRPVFHILDSDGTFKLQGTPAAFQGLSQTSQIVIDDFGGGGTQVSTTPSVLARYLLEQGPVIEPVNG